MVSVATAFGLEKWTKIDPRSLFFNSKSWNLKCELILSPYNWKLNRKCAFRCFSGSPRGALGPKAVAAAFRLEKWRKIYPKSLYLHEKLRNSKCGLILSPYNWILNRKCAFRFFNGSPRGALGPRAVGTTFGLEKWTKIGFKSLFFNSKSWNSKCELILSPYNWILNQKCAFRCFSGSPRGALSRLLLG